VDVIIPVVIKTVRQQVIAERPREVAHDVFDAALGLEGTRCTLSELTWQERMSLVGVVTISIGLRSGMSNLQGS
jgi:hypothetical protein